MSAHINGSTFFASGGSDHDFFGGDEASCNFFGGSRAEDGIADDASCGSGTDTAAVDAGLDVVNADCEGTA